MNQELQPKRREHDVVVVELAASTSAMLVFADFASPVGFHIQRRMDMC